MNKNSLLLIPSVLFVMLLHGQERLELLETNIPAKDILSYTDSYLWTKNWWLVSGVLVDTGKGGNAISKKSFLTKNKIDSLSKEFKKHLSVELVRFGNLVPKINFNAAKKPGPYIKTSVYEIQGSSVKLIGQFMIEFDTDKHNAMPDVYSLQILDPAANRAYSDSTIIKILKRKPTIVENELTPPMIQRN